MRKQSRTTATRRARSESGLPGRGQGRKEDIRGSGVYPASRLPAERWRELLDEFSREHEGWMVTLSVSGADRRSSTEMRHLPLVGVTMDSNDPADRRVVVMVGDETEDHLSHTIASAKAIRIDDDQQVLEIESDNGGRTVLKWSSPPSM